MAIKGKTKRSQSRPARRPAAGPRIQSVERRAPWYKATAFPVTLAVVALVITLVAAVQRTQTGYARDDVARFTTQMEEELADLNSVIGAGTEELPGFDSASQLTSGDVKREDFVIRATGWSAKLEGIRNAVAITSVGEVPIADPSDGVPVNGVGGHVPSLTSVRDMYAAAVGMYVQAANTYQRAAEAPEKSELAAKLVGLGQAVTRQAGETMDAAAQLLARVRARYGLDVTRQMPGESQVAFGNRYAPAGSGTQPTLPPNFTTPTAPPPSVPPTTAGGNQGDEGDTSTTGADQ